MCGDSGDVLKRECIVDEDLARVISRIGDVAVVVRRESAETWKAKEEEKKKFQEFR